MLLARSDLAKPVEDSIHGNLFAESFVLGMSESDS